jgi:hypothetical protein
MSVGAVERRKPVLQVVREGNPGHRPVPESLVLPPAELDEPDWLHTFPAVRDKDVQAGNRRAREVARREWRRVVPALKHSAGLADVDAPLLHDYCVCVACWCGANAAGRRTGRRPSRASTALS